MSRIPGGSLGTFFVLTYAVTWTCFISLATLAVSTRTPVGALVVLLGVFAPGLVALSLTARAEGGPGVRALLGRILRWRVAAQWYLFAAGYIAAIKLTVALVYRVATGVWPPFGHEPWYLILGAIVVSTPVQAGAEIGCRGYVLPRLTRRFGLARASILLGVIWAGWHLPQFFIPESDTYGQSFFVFVLQVTALSVAMAIPLMTSTATQAHARVTADGHPRRTGHRKHQSPNPTSATLRTTNPRSWSCDTNPVRNRAGGNDSHNRPTYSSTEWAA